MAKSAKDDKERRSPDDYSAVMRESEPCDHPLASFAAKPLNTSFDIQASNEHIVLLLRQHPLTQVKWVITSVFLAVLPTLFAAIGLLSFLPISYRFAATVGWYLLVLGFVVESFIKWFYNVYIITDERIIDVDFHSLIFKDVSAAKIDNIEDSTASTGGFWGSFFDYGTITIQTAAEKREFEFESVPHPNRVAKLINEMMLEEEREKLEGRVS